MKNFKLITSVIFILLSGQSLAKQESSEIEEIWQLKSEILDLKSRMEVLEKANNTPSPTATKVPAGKAHWRKIKNGMTKDQVVNLLGTPVKIDNYSGSYIYGYDSLGIAHVSFNNSGLVDGWNEP